MEEDERKKKLRAGKEKLAAFRKKKTKRKRQSDVAEGFDDEAVSPVRSDSSLDSSAEYTSSSDVSYASCEDPDSDGMSGDEISGQADMREIIKTRTKLRQTEDRISELEESLMGKQLALDKVIQENTQLKSKSEVKKLEELEAAVLKRDDIIKHLTVQLQLGVPTESQQQYRMETENLAKQVQLLQSQLQKAGQLLQSQSDKQNMSSQALQDAKTQILNLQDVITEKNTVLNQVSQNLNKFTEEYSALKNMYETVKQRESETNQVVQQLMADAEVMRKQDKQNESVGKSSDDTDDTEKKLQALRSELEEMYGLQIAEMKQEVIQQFNLEKESLIKERDMLLAEMAKVKDDYQNAVQQSEEYIREKDNLSDELDKMSEDYEKETNRVREIQHKLKEFEAIVNNTSELQQECKLLRVQNDELKNKINSQQDSVVELKAELEILSNENIRFKDQMACLTQELDKQCNENSVAVHEKAKLSEQLNSLDNELTVARQENKSHMDKIENMKDVIHSLRGELESSEKEKEELAQKCDDISKSLHVERQKRDQEIERLKHQLENKSDRTVNSDISTDSQVWEDSDTLTDSKIDSCHRNSVDLLTSQEQQVLDIIDKVLDVDENVCETDSVSAYRDPYVLTTENIFIETDNIEPEIDIPVCENNQMISETVNKLSESGNKICNTDTLNSETDYKLSGSPQVEEQMDKVVCLTLDTEKNSQPESPMKTDIVEPLAEISEIHFQSHTIHSDSFDDKDSGVISESMTFDLDGESLKVRESELQPIGTEHFQSRLEQVTNENEAFKLDIKKLNEQIEVMNTELELLKEDRQKLQVELDIVKHEKSTSTHEHSEESKYDSETTAVNKDGHQNVYGEKMISLETEFNQSIDEKLENLLEENEELRKNLTDVSIELEKVKCEDYSELERSELEDKVHQMELKINSYVAGEASLLQENEQLKELNSELQLQVDELQVREKDLKLLKVEMDETVEVKERDFQKMVEEQMVEHEEFDFEKEELLKTNREMRKELDQLSVCEQNTRDECELLEEKCKILDTEIKEYETKTSDLEAQNQTLTLKVGDLEELLNSVRLDEESRSVGEQKAKDECEMLSEKCKILDTDIREYESKTANLEAQNQALTLKIEDLEKLLNTVKLDEQSPASSDEVKVQDSSNEDLLNSKEDLLNKIEDLEAKVEILSMEKADLQEKEVALAMVIEEKNKSDEKMLEFQERTREKIEELTNTINEKEERLRQTENRYDTEIQILKTENQKLVKSLEDDLKNATEREEMLQTNAEKFRFEMEALIDKNEYLSKLVDELQTPGVTSTNDDEKIQLEEKVVAETISECENVYGTISSPSVVTSDTPSDSYKPEMAEVQKKSARKSLMKQFSKDSLEDRESSVEKEVPGVDSCDQVEEESEDVVNMIGRSQEKSETKMLQTENSDLRAKVTELENKVSEFEKIWADKQNMIDILTNENRDIMATITRKDEIIAETTKEFDMVSMEIKNIKEENLHLKTENNKFESMLDGKDTLENKTQRDVEKLKSLNDNLKRENAELIEECDSFKSQLMTQADGLNSYKCSQEKLEKQNLEMTEKITNLQTCFERLEKENSEMNICLVQLGAELTEKVQLLEKKEDLLEMAGKDKSVNLIIMEQDKIKISQLEADMNELVTKLTETETELNKTSEKLKIVCKEKELMESDINGFVTKLTKTETELNKTTEKLEAVFKEKESMESDISEFVTKLNDRETELNKTTEKLEAVCKEKESLETETTSNLAEIVDLKEKIEKRNQENAEMLKEKLLLEEEIVELRNYHDKEEESMKMEKEKLQNEKDELEVKVGELEEKCKQEKESFEEQLKNEKQNFEEKLEKQKKHFEELLKNEKEHFEGELEEQKQNFEEKFEKQNQNFEEELGKEKQKFEIQLDKQKVDFEEKVKKEKEDFDTKIEAYEKMQNDQKELQTKVEELEGNIKQEKESFEEKMKNEKENYEEQFEKQKQNFEEELDKQKQEFQEKMETENENYKEQLKMLKQNFEEKLEKQKQDFEEKMKKEKEDFDAKIEIYDGKMIEIVTNGQSIKESCETMMEEIKKERDVKAEDLRSMTESYDLLKQEFNDMKGIIQELEEERESSRNKIRTLEEELETSRNKLKDLEEKIAFTERLEVYDGESSEKDDLREELNSLKSNCEKLRNELNFKDSELEVLKNEKSELQNKIQELENKNELLRKNENELELLQARIQELEEENELLKENRDELESELGTAAESLQTAVKRRGNSNTEMDDLRKELHALTEIRNELMAQVESLGSNLTDSRKLSEELSQELKKVAVEKDKEMSKNKQLVMEKKGLKLKLEKLEKDNGKLQAAVENLKKENSQLLEARKENSDTAEKFNNLNEKIIELDEEVKMERKEKMRYIEIAEQYGNIEDELKLEREEKMKYLKSAETLTLQHEETVKKCEELEETVKLEQNKRKDIERQYQIMVEDIEALKLKRDDLLETKEDMADCLQDLQSKYEDVRSLMEGTQKEYEKEIGDLQTQLNNVGDNFKSLTSVVDSLENDLKEKNKENKELMSSLQQERDLRESLSAEQDHQNTLTAKNQKDHKNRTMMGSSQNEREIQEQEAGVQTEIDFTTMEGLIQNANNDSGFLVVEENLQCQEVYSLESLLPQTGQGLSGNHGNNIEQTPKTTSIIQSDQLESNSHLSTESEIVVCSSDGAGDFTKTEKSIPAFQSETMQGEQISIPAFRSESVEENQVSPPAFRSETAEHISLPAFHSETAEHISLPAFRSETAEHISVPAFHSETAEHISLPAFRSETAEHISIPAFCSETAEHISTPAFRSETAELEEAQILPADGQCREVQASIQQDQDRENQQISINLDEVQQKLLDEKLEDKMKEAMKHKEYDIQEKYELMFRDKQAEIMVRYDKEKKDYQKEMEQILKHKVETVKAEKDQAFVKSLQRMRKDFDKKHRRKMEKLRLKLLQEIAEGDGTEMEEEIREVVQKLNMENQELAEARDALLQQVNQLSHYRQEQLQQDPNLNIGQHGAATDESSSKQETTNEEPVIQNRHQYRSQSLMLDWEFSPHSSFDYDGDGFDEHLGDTDEDICLRPECQVLRHRLQVISEHLIEGFKPESSGSPESSCDYNTQEHGQGFKPEDDFLSASGNNEFVTTPTTELESSFVREALRMEVESAKKRLESTKSGVDDVFVSSKTENIESKDQEQDARSSTPDPNVIKEGFISDSSNQNTPTNSPLRRSLSNQEDGFIAESDMSKLQDIGRRFRDRMSSQEKKEQFIEDTKTRQNLSLSGDGFIAESDPENVFNIQKTDIKRSKSVPLAKIMISSPERNIHTEKRPVTAPSEVSTTEDVFIAESSTTNMADNLGNDSNKSPKMLGNFSDVKISLSQGSKYAPGEEAINYLKTGDTHFIGEGFVSSEIAKVKNELDNFSSIPKETDAPGAESSDTRNDFQSIEEENTLLKQEKLKLEMKVKDILKMYNKEKNELMDECNRIKIKLENETLCRQQLEQELLEFNEDFEKTGQDDDDENLGKEESRTSKSESTSKVSSGFQMMQDIVKEKDKIISDYDKKLHRSFESLENSEKKCDELEKLVGSLEEIVKDKEEEIKEMKEEMNKKCVDVSNEYSVMTLDDLERPLNKSLAEKSVGIESPQYKRTELTENLSEKFKKQVLTLQRELEKKNKLVEELSLNGDVEMKLLKQKLVEFEKLLADKDHYIGKLEEELEHLTKMVNDQFDFVDYRAKMEQSFKEKEKYIKTLEEHFLKHDTFDSSPKSAGSASRTSPVRTSSPSQAGSISFQDSGIGRQEYKTPITRNQFPDVDFWNFSTSSTVSAQRSLFRSTGSHYGSSDQRSLSSYSGSSGEQEQIRSGLGPEEDGHYALELKHFKLVDEISGLRRELRETKAIYNKENSLLQEALEKEKSRKDLNNSLSPKSETYSVDHTLQINELKQNISVLQESNCMLQIENDKWLKRVQEQECIVLELQAQTTSEVDDGRIEKIYGQQIKQLQNQRNDLMERLREINMENTNLSFQLGEKAILEETLRREKDLLKAKLSEKDDIEKELRDKTVELEKQVKAQVKLEEVLDHKNQVEKELMRQKRMLELELSEIECKLREKEELLQMQKDDLMREMREKDSSRVSSLCSSRSDLTSEASSYASSVLSTQSSPAHMGRLDSMLDRARKQHTYAVDSLKHVLKSEQEPHDTRSRDRHRPSLSSLRSQHFHKVPRK